MTMTCSAKPSEATPAELSVAAPAMPAVWVPCPLSSSQGHAGEDIVVAVNA
jgi:hypothetical protein